MAGVVLDACVLIPASLRSTLLRAAAADLYRPHWSAHILDEVERNLATITDRARARQTVSWLLVAFPEAQVRRYVHLVPSMPNHIEDRHVLAAAVAAGAQTIVTTNLRDFPLASLAPFAIDVQSPDAFLCNLADLALDRLREVIQQQAAALRHPPLTVDELLDKLAVHTPQFVEIVRTR